MELGSYWHSLRHQQPRQILNRLRYELAWKLYPRLPGAVRTWCERDARTCRPRNQFNWPENPPAAAGHLGGNRFRFLNQEVDFGERIDWNPPGRSLLWRFHLHYFDWAAGCDPELLGRQMLSWIEQNPSGTWPGWHPYPTSLRIGNWICAMVHRPSPEAVRSLALQAAFLGRNIEFHLRGNHLLENARALLVAGLYFEGPAADRWEQKGTELLRRELGQQVLPDGGHCERSPYYHHRITHLVTEAIGLLHANGRAVPPELPEAAQRMKTFEQALRHQDGSLPWFHDSLGEENPASPPAVGLPRSFPTSGYFILEGLHGRLIADYGAPAGSPNPAHQHAGIFSFEISTGGCRVVVDTGTETYDPGPQRDRLRSTAAHNTVRVDGQNQFEVWDSFRVGRRAGVGQVEERREAPFQAISAVHDGYVRLGVEHRRTIICLPGAGWLIVDDVAGRGSHRVESFLHLGPRMTPAADGDRVSLEPAGWVVLPFGLGPPPEILADRVSPAAGINETASTLRLQPRGELPCRFGYFLGRATGAGLTWDGSDTFVLQVPTNSITIRLQKNGLNRLEVRYN